MKNLEKYRGVIPAFYACYDEKGNVSPERVRSLTQYFIDKGVKGVYVNGSSGECIYQGVEERKVIIENVMAVAKGKLTVIDHVACNNTRDSVELARHAESVGVDAIASIPPIYFRLPEYSIAAYWNAISAAAPNTDFVIYNIPQLAGTALTMSLFTEMMQNPNVIGVKNSSMPTQDIQMFKAAGKAAKGDFIVFNGPDEQFVAGRAIGADGGIGGTYGVMPELFLKLNELIANGAHEQAIALQYDINEIIYKMCSGRANMYAVAKEMLRVNAGLDIGGVREPLENLQDGDRAVAREAAAMVRSAIAKHL
ncbi:MAG: dihydrodipicolinate synthase family protein [Clostridia bacterium]